MSGMPVTKIQRFLSGKRGLTLKTADKLAKALDMVLMTRPGSTLAIDLVREREEAREKREGND
jgi:plasmid maintenance system antidote protein VapI